MTLVLIWFNFFGNDFSFGIFVEMSAIVWGIYLTLQWVVISHGWFLCTIYHQNVKVLAAYVGFCIEFCWESLVFGWPCPSTYCILPIILQNVFPNELLSNGGFAALIWLNWKIGWARTGLYLMLCSVWHYSSSFQDRIVKRCKRAFTPP